MTFRTSQLSPQARNRVAIATIVALLVAIAPGQMAVRSMLSSLDQAEQVSAQANEKANRVVAARNARDQKEAFDKRLAAAEAALPQNIDMQGAITQIQQAANAAGVSWTQGTPAPVVEAEKEATGEPAADKPAASATSYSITITAEGQLNNISAFVANLRKIQRLVVVDSVSSSVSESRHTARITAYIYTVPQGAKS